MTRNLKMLNSILDVELKSELQITKWNTERSMNGGSILVIALLFVKGFHNKITII